MSAVVTVGNGSTHQADRRVPNRLQTKRKGRPRRGKQRRAACAVSSLLLKGMTPAWARCRASRPPAVGTASALSLRLDAFGALQWRASQLT